MFTVFLAYYHFSHRIVQSTRRHKCHYQASGASLLYMVRLSEKLNLLNDMFPSTPAVVLHRGSLTEKDRQQTN